MRSTPASPRTKRWAWCCPGCHRSAPRSSRPNASSSTAGIAWAARTDALAERVRDLGARRRVGRPQLVGEARRAGVGLLERAADRVHPGGADVLAAALELVRQPPDGLFILGVDGVAELFEQRRRRVRE